VLFQGDALPYGDRSAVLVDEFAPGPYDERVGFFDVVSAPNDRNGWLCVSARFEVPPEIADPQDEVGNESGALIDFEAEQLVGILSGFGVSGDRQFPLVEQVQFGRQRRNNPQGDGGPLGSELCQRLCLRPLTRLTTRTISAITSNK